jgi:hypothetical protein
MPETTTQPVAAPTTGAAALRIVLFGMTDAGKSSLLGALAQAAQTQEQAFNGRLTDRSQGLAELQQRLYEERPRETLEEVVPYPVAVESFGPGGTRVAREAILYDCDGRVANDLLSRHDNFNTDGALARAILQADTLVLVVDAAAGSAVLDRDFAQFGDFLHLLEQNRGQRSDVGGLPVFLVLTKCDLLAQKTDNSAGWMDRIEERKRQVGTRFQEFLSQQAERGPLPFGRVELNLWATAVKRPALADAPARPREPYGVAELFRQCLDSADGFHERRLRAGRRLNYTVGIAATVAGFMVLFSLLLFFTGPSRAVSELDRAIRSYRTAAADAGPEGYKEPEEEIKRLESFKENPEVFKELSPEVREYVDSKLAELRAYQEYKSQVDRVLEEFGRFDSVNNLAELNNLRGSLDKLPVPVRYSQDWKQTDAVHRRQVALEDTRRLQHAVGGEVAWYQGRIQKGNALIEEGSQFVSKKGTSEQRDRWLKDSKTFLDEEPRHTDKDVIADTSTRLTYGQARKYREVAKARGDYDDTVKTLKELRRLVLRPRP